MTNKFLVTVIIPVFNGDQYLGEAIKSVLDQTYQNFELVIVDDASTIDISGVINSFKDSRINYIRHETNLGANNSRNTGIKMSSGKIIAFLDQDDLFHREKLSNHVEYLSEHPDVGFTYNSRFELNYSAQTIRNIWRPPASMTLAELVQGFPISPSDMVVVRDWLNIAGMWDKKNNVHGGEITFAGRLFLSGCRFAFINKVLNYRRFETGRFYKDIRKKCDAELACQEEIISDPRFPQSECSIRNRAFMNSYLTWAYNALVQNETSLGQEYLINSVRLDPSIIEGNPCELINYFSSGCITDENRDHSVLLRKIFDQLPEEFSHLNNQYKWAVAYGFLIKAIRATIWNRENEGRLYFQKIAREDLMLDEQVLGKIADDILNFEYEYGPQASQDVLLRLAPYIRNLEGQYRLNQLKGKLIINRSFMRYRNGEYQDIPREVLTAIRLRPKYMLNRGVLSILVRSVKLSVFK